MKWLQVKGKKVDFLFLFVFLLFIGFSVAFAVVNLSDSADTSDSLISPTQYKAKEMTESNKETLELEAGDIVKRELCLYELLGGSGLTVDKNTEKLYCGYPYARVASVNFTCVSDIRGIANTQYTSDKLVDEYYTYPFDKSPMYVDIDGELWKRTDCNKGLPTISADDVTFDVKGINEFEAELSFTLPNEMSPVVLKLIKVGATWKLEDSLVHYLENCSSSSLGSLKE